MLREFVLTLALAAACHPTEPGGAPRRDARAADRPAMQACTVDADCAVLDAVGPSPDDPCCDATMAGASVSRRYLEWHAEHRKQHCAAAKCPPLALPGPPMLACGSEPRCKLGTCGNACSDPKPPP